MLYAIPSKCSIPGRQIVAPIARGKDADLVLFAPAVIKPLPHECMRPLFERPMQSAGSEVSRRTASSSVVACRL
jgi:hypothetical protein